MIEFLSRPIRKGMALDAIRTNPQSALISQPSIIAERPASGKADGLCEAQSHCFNISETTRFGSRSISPRVCRARETRVLPELKGTNEIQKRL